MINDGVSRLVLDADSGSLTDVIILHCLLWLGDIVHMSAHCLSFHYLLEVPDMAGRGDVGSSCGLA